MRNVNPPSSIVFHLGAGIGRSKKLMISKINMIIGLDVGRSLVR